MLIKNTSNSIINICWGGNTRLILNPTEEKSIKFGVELIPILKPFKDKILLTADVGEGTEELSNQGFQVKGTIPPKPMDDVKGPEVEIVAIEPVEDEEVPIKPKKTSRKRR